MSSLSSRLSPLWNLVEVESTWVTRKKTTYLQFVKYGFCGITALAVDMVVFFLIAWLLLPAISQDDIFVRLLNLPVEPVHENLRTINFLIGNVIAFMVSNLAAYILNVLFVFTAGRHDRLKEVMLFYLSSAVSVAIGIGLAMVLIDLLAFSTTCSYIIKAVISTLINYAFRKVYVFQS